MLSHKESATGHRSSAVSDATTHRPESPHGESGDTLKRPVKKPPAFTVGHLRDAISGGHVLAEYQPKVPFDPNLDSYGVEVLCRLRHPAFGQVYPDVFIQLAEKNGLIAELTDAVVRQAFSDWRKWYEHGLTMRLAINVSPELLDGSAWADRFLACCAEFGIAAEYITLEITESSSKAASESAVDVLARLKLKGITLSIDDFGTGFSSLATLYRLPFGELKIDKCFVMELERDPAARALIESTVEMAQRLGLKVTAEGVETDSTFAQLRLIGCDDAQGYFISKSLPAAEIPPFFAEWKKSRTAPGDGNPSFASRLVAIQSLLSEAAMPENTNETLMISPIQLLEQDAPILDIIAAIPPLGLQGRLLPALAACHKAVGILKTRYVHAALKKHILELQRLLEHRLLSNGPLILANGSQRVHLHPRRSALIGRSADEKPVDIVINCRWLSRGERNLYLYFDRGDWLIEDLGSTNGAVIAGTTLAPGNPISIPRGCTTVEIGRSKADEAPLSLCVARCGANQETITVRAVAGTESDPLTWPTREQDLQSLWIVSREDVSIGSAPSCTIRTDDPGAAILADIRFQNGYWIAPRPGVPLSIEGVTFESPVPLPSDTTVEVGNSAFVVQSCSRQPATTWKTDRFAGQVAAGPLRTAEGRA
jgi:EAL domain-containing protein (putative c-di-GMP-specific phosphodiesterase class I)